MERKMEMKRLWRVPYAGKAGLIVALAADPPRLSRRRGLLASLDQAQLSSTECENGLDLKRRRGRRYQAVIKARKGKEGVTRGCDHANQCFGKGSREPAIRAARSGWQRWINRARTTVESWNGLV